jgi:hypothetical protein
MPIKRHLAVYYYSQAIDRVNTQPVYSNLPEFSSKHWKEQFRVVSTKKYPHAPKYRRDLIHNPSETEWPQMAALVERHLYALDSTRKVRTQALTARWFNISRHFVQEQTDPYAFNTSKTVN